jgi:hypothetical protein
MCSVWLGVFETGDPLPSVCVSGASKSTLRAKAHAIEKKLLSFCFGSVEGAAVFLQAYETEEENAFHTAFLQTRFCDGRVPPVAAAHFSNVQQRQGFDAKRRRQLRNRRSRWGGGARVYRVGGGGR